MRSSFIRAEVLRFLDKCQSLDGIVPKLVEQFGIHESYALELYNEWAMRGNLTFKAVNLEPVTDPDRTQELDWHPPDPTNSDIEVLRRQICAWADECFPDRTLAECFAKLTLDELPEVWRNPTDPEEYADVLVLVLDMATLAIREHNTRNAAQIAAGTMKPLTMYDIAQAVRDKMKVNRERKWHIDPITGLRQHNRET